MSEDTPRGYTYPEYVDTQDFPAQIQELATDIDADVQGIYNDVSTARNAPSCRIRRAVGTALASGVTTNVAFDTELYDNAAMWAIGAPTNIVIPSLGSYLVTAWAQFDAAAAGGFALFLQSAGGLIPAPATITKAPDNDKRVTLSATALTRCNAAETITVGLRQTSGAPVNTFIVEVSVTKVST